jgi:hypothetical protein
MQKKVKFSVPKVLKPAATPKIVEPSNANVEAVPGGANFHVCPQGCGYQSLKVKAVRMHMLHCRPIPAVQS